MKERLKRGLPPSHPGLILKEMYLTPLDITLTELAAKFKVARKTISELVNGKVGVSAEMSLRLAKAFNTSPEFWLNLQRNYDLFAASNKVSLTKIRPFRLALSEKTKPKTRKKISI
ncbi:HigA family addiction module antitoxin [Sediminibacterium sp.]|uniref:HigA family addiction module antitoxin n=1 Tax=Sediminibacterium sp. TaxID=1917865 RepID=UPI00271A8348|nr:HigA family addiction module antitoxin [Sediminibacterium sp.]MDO8997760.1 HigA family addiction module antitoxin [Sediminibacterium sp.]MDO9157569.1 HigA family addiction module antitoxin [Sediminibacterium sp.]MDP1972200.1 HigA family addiction module antitoxin [Sediminibacterium sp.]MDP2421588.1 HigA family addiction module antitoxin [Sediminibacterium sp.]